MVKKIPEYLTVVDRSLQEDQLYDPISTKVDKKPLALQLASMFTFDLETYSDENGSLIPYAAAISYLDYYVDYSRNRMKNLDNDEQNAQEIVKNKNRYVKIFTGEHSCPVDQML